MEERTKREIFICDCNSAEHQFSFWHNKKDSEIYLETHLTNYQGFWKRLWIGIKYAFGYKCRYGHFDSTIIQPEDIQRLKNYINKL